MISPEYAQSGLNYYLTAIWTHLVTQYPWWFYQIVLPFGSLTLSYTLCCTLFYVLEEYFGSFVAKYKIQPKVKNSRQRINHALIHLVKLYLLVMLPLYVLAFPFMRKLGFSESLVLPPWHTMLVQLVICLLIEDFSHYWIHRFLHLGWMYRNIHVVHHEFTAPSAFAASYSHPLEVLLQGLGTFAGPLLLRPHFFLFYVWVNLRQLSAVEAHCGYDFPFSPNHWIPFSGGAEFHDFHHRTFNGAFSSNFTIWDRVFGTDAGFHVWREKQAREQQHKKMDKLQ